MASVVQFVYHHSAPRAVKLVIDKVVSTCLTQDNMPGVQPPIAKVLCLRRELYWRTPDVG